MQKEELPKNPAMLLSVVNMHLRDSFNGNLEALCRAWDIRREELLDLMKQAGWEWNEEAKKFW